MSDVGVKPTTLATSTPSTEVDSNPYGGYYGGGGGYYGGGGGGGAEEPSTPTEEQEKAAKNLGAIVGYNVGTLKNKAKQGDKAFDIADQQSKLLNLTQTKQNKRNSGNDWYTRQQKLQSVSNWLADASGNAMYGSFYNDLGDLIARQDDMDDVAVLNQMRENQNQIDNDYYEAIMANNNSRNELYLDTEADLRELAADYASQLNNIHPDLAENILNPDKKTLNVPHGNKKEEGSDEFDFLNTRYFGNHVKDAVKPATQGLYRPANDAVTARRKEYVNKKNTGQFSDSTNEDYWLRARRGYKRRTQ